MHKSSFLIGTALAGALIGSPAQSQVLTIQSAIKQTVTTNPGVYEASANRRATESEMRQVQSTLLPQVRLEARFGPEKFDYNTVPIQTGNSNWRQGEQYSVVVRQLLFDGFSSVNEIWRQSARVDAAAMRTYERTELLALDAAETYIDVVRYLRLINLAERNVQAHREILSNVQSRYSGGRAGEGDLAQTQERVAAAEAALAQFKQNLDEARARFRKVVGVEPHNLRWPGRLPAMPATKDESLAVALRYNPTIRAAQYDADAAKHAFKATDGAFMPNVALEARANTGDDYNFNLGRRDEYSAKVVVSWDVFRGGQDLWRRNEMAERYIENTQRHARLQRDALESIDRAWAARTITSERIAALQRQVDADRRTISAYTKEYDIGQRSLIDLLNAQNQVFTASVSLYSTQGVAVFADYQLLAAMGHLMTYLKEPHVIDALPLEVKPFLLFPTKIAPLNLTLPDESSQPLLVANPNVAPNPNYAGNMVASAGPGIAVASASPATASDAPAVITFNDRWDRQTGPSSVLAAVGAWFTNYANEPVEAPSNALGYASQPAPRRDVPAWFTMSIPTTRK